MRVYSMVTHPELRGWVFCFWGRKSPISINLLIIFLVSSIACVAAHAQNSVPVKFEVDKILFVGNSSVESDELLDVIYTRETPGAISQFLYGIFGEKFGSKSVVFDPGLISADVEKLKDFYQGRGFFDVQVRDSISHDTTKSLVTVWFIIDEGQPSIIESLEYRGLGNLPRNLWEKIFGVPHLEAGAVFAKQLVDREIERVLRILENNGYPNAQFDRQRSMAQRFLSKNAIVLTLVFTTGEEIRFGVIGVNVDPPREDITDDIVIKQLDFETGDIYSAEKRVSSERNLNRLGIFEVSRINTISPAEAETTGTLPVEVFVRPRDKHELSPEITISDENNAFNLGFGLGYTNRNFFGDARSFNARSRLRTQSIQDWNLGSVFQGKGLREPTVLGAAELQFYLAQPYLFTRSLSGTWTFLLSAEKHSLYILPIVRNKIGITNRFDEMWNGFVEWTLERVSVEFIQPIDSTTTPIDLTRRREEERPQFNSILSVTLQRDATNDIFSPSSGSFASMTVEESGILPQVLKNLQPNLPFTAFYKVSLIGKWFQDVTDSRYNIFAYKLRTGYQDKYGVSRQDSTRRIPLNRRFFGGGSGSVRGWKSRDLGTMPASELQFGGNFIIEGSYEMRINYLRGFGKLWFIDLNNVWIVYFLDAGNVWASLKDFKARELAVAAGSGIRYETVFGPLRVDFGFRVYDPKETVGKKWFHEKRFFGDVLSNGVLHFGLGHSF
jgi:outer membrane protein insertion porin family